MSTDYYLISPSYKVKTMVGSDGMSGVQVWTDNTALPFIRWAISEFVYDVRLVSEHYLEGLDPEGDFTDWKP